MKQIQCHPDLYSLFTRIAHTQTARGLETCGKICGIQVCSPSSRVTAPKAMIKKLLLINQIQTITIIMLTTPDDGGHDCQLSAICPWDAYTRIFSLIHWFPVIVGDRNTFAGADYCLCKSFSDASCFYT